MDYKSLRKEAGIFTPRDKYEEFLFTQIKIAGPRMVAFFLIVFMYGWLLDKYGEMRVFISMFAILVLILIDIARALYEIKDRGLLNAEKQ